MKAWRWPVTRWDAGKGGGWPEHLVMSTELQKASIKRAAALRCTSPLAFLRSLFETVVFTRHLVYCAFPLTRS